MKRLEKLFDNNRNWAQSMTARDPEFFERLARQQAPEFLWIGCSDSRVPANDIVGLWPGELFVHRNVANVVVHSDLNCLSVLQYAVDALQVKHIIICGHYGCGGIEAAYYGRRLGLIDNWLRHVQDVWSKHDEHLSGLPSDRARIDRLCELNVIEQAFNVAETTIIQDAWARDQKVTIHAWVYGLDTGLLRDLGCCLDGPEDVEFIYRSAISAKPT